MDDNDLKAVDDIMKHVLIIIQNNSFPFDRRVLKEARSLTGAGYRVTVISPMSGLDPAAEAEFEGIRILRYRNFESQGGIAAFFLEYANAIVKILFLSLKVYLETPFQILHVSNPPDFFWPMGFFFKLFGVQFIYDQRDIAPEMLKANQGRSGILYRILLLNERLTVRCASGIIAVNQSLKKRLIRLCNAGEKPLAIVYNSPNADFDAVYEPLLAAQYEGRKVILFVGLMAPLDGVETLVHVAKKMMEDGRHSDCVFVLLGDGPERTRVGKMVEDQGLHGRVVFKGRVDYETVKNYLSLADVCVAPDEKNDFSDHFTLVKVLEYMKAGKPFVGFRLNETCAIAGEAGCYADSVDEFVEKIEWLLDDPDAARRLGEKGREIIGKQFLWEHQASQLLKLYEQVLGFGK